MSTTIKPEIHEKAWGREIWVANNEKYCGKILELKKGYRCSVHHHKKKDETFYILSGKVLMEAYGKKNVMKRGDALRILPNTKHRFTGLCDGKILEISTHHEEEDSYREEGMLSGEVPKHEFEKLSEMYA
jgi:quercetin dioxygenase-like cupin family protein